MTEPQLDPRLCKHMIQIWCMILFSAMLTYIETTKSNNNTRNDNDTMDFENMLIDLFQFGYIFTQEGLFTMDDGEYFLQPTRVNSQNVSDDIVGGPYMVRKMQPTQPDMEFGASGKKAIRTR